MPSGAHDEPTPREAWERLRRRNEERVRSLHAEVEADERVVATGSHVLVTDRRIIFRDLNLYESRHTNRRTTDALRFDEITGWALGRRHDERPLLHLRHGPHVRVEWVPHRLLWHRWDRKARTVTFRESTLPFNRRRDPALREIVARLEADEGPRGKDFVITLGGTREERGGSAVLYWRRS